LCASAPDVASSVTGDGGTGATPGAFHHIKAALAHLCARNRHEHQPGLGSSRLHETMGILQLIQLEHIWETIPQSPTPAPEVWVITNSANVFHSWIQLTGGASAPPLSTIAKHRPGGEKHYPETGPSTFGSQSIRCVNRTSSTLRTNARGGLFSRGGHHQAWRVASLSGARPGLAISIGLRRHSFLGTVAKGPKPPTTSYSNNGL